MKPYSRSFLRRPPWLCRPSKTPSVRRAWPALPKTDPKTRLVQELGETLSSRNPSFLLDRAIALELNQIRGAPWNLLRVRFSCPRSKQPLLDQFHLYLWRSYANPANRKTAKALWRLYLRLALTSPAFLRALPSKAWNILFRAQSLRVIAEPKVVVHLNQLINDMRTAGHKASFEQRLVHIETLFGQGKREAAIETWQQGYQSDSHMPEYLELGVRMYAVAGNVMRAQELLIDLFASHPALNPRLILYVFDAHLNVPDEGTKHGKQAWALYIYLKDILGDSMTVQDYERCYTSFLKARYRTHALAVFRDMMSAEELHGPEGHKASASILKGFNDLTATLDGAEQLNELFLSGLASLPRQNQNKFFFSKWINRLVRAGDVDGAAQVFELMFERDVQPQARHLNTLIRGWIRSRNSDNIQKAETLALQMIVERIALVRRRCRLPELIPQRLSEGVEPRERLFLRRTLPPATSETFGLLRQIYLRRGDKPKLLSLQTWQVVHAELPTHTKALNTQLAFYLELGQLSEVFRAFKRDVLRRPSQKVPATIPDIGTFVLLWEASGFKQRTVGRSTPWERRSSRTSFPPPSIILRHTLAWLSALSEREGPSAHAAVLATVLRSRIPNHIIATYTAWNDLAGALVALNLLHRRLGHQTDQYATNLVTCALARLGFPKADVRSRTPARRRRLNASVGLHHNLDKLLRALHALLQRRLLAATSSSSSLPPKQKNDAAVVAPSMSDEHSSKRESEMYRGNDKKEKEEEEPPADDDNDDDDDDDDGLDRHTMLLDALSELTRAVMLRMGVPPAQIEARVKGAKRNIGLDPAMPTGDKTAWEVAEELGMGR